MSDVERQAKGAIGFVEESAPNHETPFLKRCFRPLFILLRFTGLYLPNSRSVGNRKNSASIYAASRMIIVAVLFLLSVYRLINFMLQISLRKLDLPTSATMVMFSWSLQACISVVFVAYWQHYGYLDVYFNLLHRAQGSIACKSNRRRIYGRFAVCLTLCILGITCSLGVSLMGFLRGGQQIALNDSIYYLFVVRELYWIAIGVLFYTLCAWFAAITIYSNCVNGAVLEVRHLNEQLAKIGENGQPAANTLLKFYITHSQLVTAVKQLDNTFEAYAFLMFGTNMPTTILSLYILLSNVHLSCGTLASTAGGVVFSVIQLWALSVTPARLHEAIHKAQEILYAEISIWYPYQEDLYRIANTFVSHVGQTYLGISIWGFALITKPLILTTISLTITYLTVMLQLKPSEEIENFESLQNQMIQNQTIQLLS